MQNQIPNPRPHHVISPNILREESGSIQLVQTSLVYQIRYLLKEGLNSHETGSM